MNTPETLVEESTRQEIFYPLIDKINDIPLILETGVFRGGNLFRIARYAKSKSKLVQLYGVDNYTYCNISSQAMEGIEGLDHYKSVCKLVQESDIAEYIILLNNDSIETAKGPFFQDGALDLIFLDSSHSPEYVRDEILAWIPKLKKGGILCGHDFPDAGVYGPVYEIFEREMVKSTTCGSSWWVQF